LNYIVDTRNDELIGRSELRMSKSNNSEYYREKPFIGFIKSEEGYERQGLGSRRVEIMHALSLQLYRLPLYSDTINSESMVALWEKLVNSEKATKIKEGLHDRYVYVN